MAGIIDLTKPIDASPTDEDADTDSRDDSDLDSNDDSDADSGTVSRTRIEK
jgi:hypothetical protein